MDFNTVHLLFLSFFRGFLLKEIHFSVISVLSEDFFQVPVEK